MLYGASYTKRMAGSGVMREEDMKALVALRRTMNITKAAEELCVTQPTLSRRIQQFESELGITILKRSNKGIEFTQKGAFLAERANMALSFMEETLNAVSAVDDAESSVIKIAAANSYAEFTLPAILRRYRNMNPSVRFDIRSMMSPDVLRLVKNGAADLGIIRGEFAYCGWQRLLSRDRCSIVSKAPLDEGALPLTHHIDYPLSAPSRRLIDGWWNERFRTPPLTLCRVSTLSIAKQMAAAGLGFLFSLIEDIDSGQNLCVLVMQNKDGSCITRDTVLIQSEQSADSSCVCACRDWLVSEGAK